MSSGFFGSFGKKDKNPSDPARSPTGSVPPPPQAKAPQPAGLTPVTARTSVTTTQPMVVPKPPGGVLKPAKPSFLSGGKSTQRIVLPGKVDSAATGVTGSAPIPVGNINLPLAMIMRILPQEIMAVSLTDFESSPEAAQEIGLPLAMILPQLPSGRIEVSVQELVPYIPVAFVKPAGEITDQLSKVVHLPLMDVVMRVPSDQLVLRADQKQVDAAVINMADPFTEEILREQARDPMEQKKKTAAIAAAPPPPIDAVTTLTTAATAPPAAPTAEARKSGAIPPLPKASGALPGVPHPTSAGLAKSGGLTKPPAPPTPAFARPPTALPVQASIMSKATAPIPRPPGGVAPPVVNPPSLEMQDAPKGAAPPPTTRLPKVTAPMPQAPSSASAPVAPAAPTPTQGDGNWSQSDEMKKLLAQAEAALGEEEPVSVSSSAVKTGFVKPPSMPMPAMPSVPPTPSPIVKSAPLPSLPPAAPPAVKSAPLPASPAPTIPVSSPQSPPPGEQAIDLNSCSAVDLQKISGCSPALAEAIVRYREQQGAYSGLKELLEVPGMTTEAYTQLTGQPAEQVPTLNEALGVPAGEQIGPREIADRISTWLDVTGCVLIESSGLPLAGNVPAPLQAASIAAFTPKLFTAFNNSFKEFSGKETDEIIVPFKGVSFYILRRHQMYLVILSHRRRLPGRYLKIARFVLARINANGRKS